MGLIKISHYFYRHIYKHNDGYRIIYRNEHYGYYENLADCLYDRDRLEQCGWDIQTWTEMPEVPNPYKHMTLPAFDKSGEYIQYIPARWRIQRKVNGKTRYYGTFKTKEEAMKRRDYLLRNGWCE